MTEQSAPPSALRDAQPARPVSRLNADRDQEEVALLLMRVADGDRVAFRHLYDLTSGRFHGLAERLLSRRDVAEDVLQEVYVRVWLHARSYDPARGAPMPWLWQVLRNAVIDRLRRDRMPLTDIDELSDILAAPAAPLETRLDWRAGWRGWTKRRARPCRWPSSMAIRTRKSPRSRKPRSAPSSRRFGAGSPVCAAISKATTPRSTTRSIETRPHSSFGVSAMARAPASIMSTAADMVSPMASASISRKSRIRM